MLAWRVIGCLLFPDVRVFFPVVRCIMSGFRNVELPKLQPQTNMWMSVMIGWWTAMLWWSFGQPSFGIGKGKVCFNEINLFSNKASN